MVFISHKNSSDDDYAIQLAGILGTNGINCWIDKNRNSINGGDFTKKIPQAINMCALFILVLTENAMESDWIKSEVETAKYYHKTIIVLKVGEFDLTPDWRFTLTHTHRISTSDSDIKWLISKCKLGEEIIEMEISHNPTRKVSLLKGDYQDNLDNLIKNNPETLDNTYFAAGIDCTSNTFISSNDGCLKYICKYLFDEFAITLDDLQLLINKAKQEQLGHKTASEPLNFKDIIVIHIPLSTEKVTRTLKLLLVANSKKKEGSTNVDDVEGIDSREIIMSVFNYCASHGDDASNLFIPAMGTNGLGFPYEVIVSEIFSCYAFGKRLETFPYSLYFSYRNEDLERQDLTTEAVLSFINTIIDFMK